jgi:hypothetical protein
MAKHRLQEPVNKRAFLTAGLAVAALAVIAGVVMLLGTLESDTGELTRQQAMLKDLNIAGIQYGSADKMTKLADVICDMDDQGLDTLSFLELGWNAKEADTIQAVILNGQYCG